MEVREQPQGAPGTFFFSLDVWVQGGGKREKDDDGNDRMSTPTTTKKKKKLDPEQQILLLPLHDQVMRRYHIQARDDYQAYNRMVGLVTRMVSLLRRLPPTDKTRIELTDSLLERLYSAGIVPTKATLAVAERLSTASLARRRLAVVMVRLRMAQTVREAATFVEQGHVRVGPHPVVDPAHHVSRSDEDFVTWVDSSRVKRAVAKYNDSLDDFDLLGA